MGVWKRFAAFQHKQPKQNASVFKDFWHFVLLWTRNDKRSLPQPPKQEDDNSFADVFGFLMKWTLMKIPGGVVLARTFWWVYSFNPKWGDSFWAHIFQSSEFQKRTGWRQPSWLALYKEKERPNTAPWMSTNGVLFECSSINNEAPWLYIVGSLTVLTSKLPAILNKRSVATLSANEPQSDWLCSLPEIHFSKPGETCIPNEAGFFVRKWCVWESNWEKWIKIDPHAIKVKIDDEINDHTNDAQMGNKHIVPHWVFWQIDALSERLAQLSSCELRCLINYSYSFSDKLPSIV